MKFVIQLKKKMGDAIWFVGKGHCFVTGQRPVAIKSWKTRQGAERAMKNLRLEDEAKVVERFFG